MKIRFIFTLAMAIGLATTLTQSAVASSYKSDQKLVENVNDIVSQMSAAQQEMVMKQAEVIQEKLRNMSQKERAELINTVRNVGNSIDFNKVDINALEKLKPNNLDQTMDNLKEYQSNF